MIFTEQQLQEISLQGEAFLDERRPPLELREKLDLAYRVEGHSVLSFEIKARWDDPSRTMEKPLAMATYVEAQKHWKVYWMQEDLKWRNYTPRPMVKTIKAFFRLVDEDHRACFFGKAKVG